VTLPSVTGALNHSRDAEDFDGTEQVAAAYAMLEVFAGSKLYILPGLRYEYAKEDFVGRNVRLAANGTWLGSDPLQAKTNYGVPLPDLHVKYAFPPDTNLRLAATRSLARPNYYDAVPYRAQDDSAGPPTITLGTAGLRPTKSWNLDAMIEHYLKSVGL